MAQIFHILSDPAFLENDIVTIFSQSHPRLPKLLFNAWPLCRRGVGPEAAFDAHKSSSYWWFTESCVSFVLSLSRLSGHVWDQCHNCRESRILPLEAGLTFSPQVELTLTQICGWYKTYTQRKLVQIRTDNTHTCVNGRYWHSYLLSNVTLTYITSEELVDETNINISSA